MKQQTFDKYVQFLRLLSAKSIYDLGFQQRKYKIADTFVSFLFRNKYLQRKVGGSVKLIDCPLGFNHIVNEYKKATEKKQPAVAEFVAAVEKAYPKHPDIDLLAREQLAIDILGQIMRDNAYITYDVVRKIKKVELTQIL